MVEDSGEVSGGVRDKLDYSNDFSLIAWNDISIREREREERKKHYWENTGGRGRREDVGVEKIGENGAEPDFQSVVVWGIVGTGSGRGCCCYAEFVN